MGIREVMLAPEPYLPPEDYDMQQHLHHWLEANRPQDVACPTEVEEFIQALTNKLPPFERLGQETMMITGYELILAGQTEINGKPIKRWVTYPLVVPRLQVVDHYSAMHRAYRRRGKSGLRRYCECHVKGPDLQKLLGILDVHVFKEDRPEFRKIMNQIKG